MAMASGRLRTPGKRVHSEPTRRPIVRSGALELADAKRSIQRSLLRSTDKWTRAWPSLLLAGGKRAPFSRRPSLTPESATVRDSNLGDQLVEWQQSGPSRLCIPSSSEVECVHEGAQTAADRSANPFDN